MAFEHEVDRTAAWLADERFAGLTRLHTARQVVEQRGTIGNAHPVAKEAAGAFYARLRALFAERRAITTFGPYSPGQAVVMKRRGIEGIYLGGWATSAKGSVTEDPGADLASYPLSQVPDEASAIVRALTTADRNQQFARSRMTPAEREANPEIDYRPFIIADADTGHGGDAHVRNLIRRFVEAGVPGYHIEDQKPGLKKCGHQGGKVLVSQSEQIQRLNAARLQLDIMEVPGIIVARTDAEAASLLDANGDERDSPFILGATNLEVPGYKAMVLAVHRACFERGVTGVRGHLMFDVSKTEHARATAWLQSVDGPRLIDEAVSALAPGDDAGIGTMLAGLMRRLLDLWQAQAGVKTYRRAVADALAARGHDAHSTVGARWRAFAKTASLADAREQAQALGADVPWSAELARTPEGYYQIEGSLEHAIARSLSAAPFADVLWMETATANLDEARQYAEAIHAVFPDKMLAYNLSPSFNWDTTGMDDEQMRRFPEELGALGFVFNFITYGGHQIDGLAAEEFSAALRHDGMLALARVQRRIRMLGSPYRTPQTLAGGPRLDAALMAATGRTATTQAMGRGSTQHQHLADTEVQPRVLETWLAAARDEAPSAWRVTLQPSTGGSDALTLRVSRHGTERATLSFISARDAGARGWLCILGQRLAGAADDEVPVLTLSHLFLLHRYVPETMQILGPTAADIAHAHDLEDLGVLVDVQHVLGHLAVAGVERHRVVDLAEQHSGLRAQEPAVANA